MAERPKPRKTDPGEFLDILKGFHIEPLETPSERSSRLRREEAEAAHQLHKDLLLFKTVNTIVAAATITCLLVIFLPWFSPDQKHWASTLFSTIVAGHLLT